MNKKIAIPTQENQLCAHFGHCEKFALYEIDGSEIINREYVSPPPHEPGSYPRFLRDLGCTTIIAGGMGRRAQQLFIDNNIDVIIGMQSDDPEILVKTYISEGLKSGENLCDH